MTGSIRVPRPMQPLLIVDDEASWMESFSIALRCTGIDHIRTCSDPRQVMKLLAEMPVEMVLLDVRMPELPGDVLLSEIKAEFPEIPVIMVTASEEVDVAVRCIQRGATNYLVKSAQKSQLVAMVHQTLLMRDMERVNHSMQESFFSSGPKNAEAFREFVTADRAMRLLFQYVEAIAESQEPILITGETGTGKELLARAAHAVSGRPGELVPVNVAGLDDEAFSDTLFGHIRGAFTGALDRRGGLIERAAGGTLFLDEIGDLSSASQVKLLRLLQEGEYLPLGVDTPKRSDARVIVATHKNLLQEKKDGVFRKDLYYRLRTHHLQIPPLRERMGDILLLLGHFAEEAGRAFSRPVAHIPPELPEMLLRYTFPGNIRELRGMVHDAVGRMTGDALPLAPFREVIQEHVQSHLVADCVRQDVFLHEPVLPTLRVAQEMLIEEAMRRANHNQSLAAQILGITRQALNQRLHRK